MKKLQIKFMNVKLLVILFLEESVPHIKSTVYNNSI